MGGVQSLYTAEKKDTLTTDDINSQIKSLDGKLSTRDRKLFNHAKTEISKEAAKLNILNATVCIEFQDRDHCLISKGEEESHGQYIRIAMNDDEECTTVWERQWFSRKVCKAVTDADLTSVTNLAVEYFPVLIKYFKKQVGWHQS